MKAKAKKLEAIRLEGTLLRTLQEEIRGIEDKLRQAQDLVRDLAKKKFAFDANLKLCL